MILDWFKTVLTMSLTATVAALAVMLLRFLLKKLSAPKLMVFLLWAVVLFRMVCPASFESPVSLLGLIPQSEGQGLLSGYAGPVSVQFDTGISPGHEDYLAGVEGGGEVVYPDGGGTYVVTGPDGASPPPTLASVWMPRLSVVWLLGAIVLCLYALISYLRLKRRVSTAIWAVGGLWETDQIDGPFVLGFFPPKIYLPLGLSGATRDYVVLHERAHIRRIDHIIKALFFLALAVHWFNPVLWLAWVLVCRDMEAACDEAVLRNTTEDIRSGYSAALLSLAGVRPVRVPLAFGENDVKGRIKGVLKYKRPVVAMVLASTLLLVIAGLALAANPMPLPEGSERLSVQLPSFDTLELTPGGDWEDAPLVSALPGTIDLNFGSYFERGPDEVTVTDYLLEVSPSPPSVVLPAGRVTGYKWERYFSIDPHPASTGAGTELRGFEILCRWRSGVSSYECRYLLRVRTPVQPLTQPVVMAAGQEIWLAKEEIFPYLGMRFAPPVAVGEVVDICHPQDGATGYHAQLFQSDESEEEWLPLNQGFGASSVDGDPVNGSSGFRLSEEDAGLLMLKLTYTYPDGSQKVWQGLLEAK